MTAPEIRREIEQEDLPEGAKPSIWNMLVPVIVLLVFIFVGLFYTGDIKTNGFFGALAAGAAPCVRWIPPSFWPPSPPSSWA